MIIQHLHKKTIRHRKNSESLQCSGNPEKPENDTKLKILKILRNYHEPSLSQGLEQYYKVTPCNEKCNFFILLTFNLLKSISLIQFLFVGTGSPRPYFRYIIQDKNNEASKYMIYGICSNIFSQWTDKIFHIQTILNQWIKSKENDTKIVTVTNSCDIKKMALNPV